MDPYEPTWAHTDPSWAHMGPYGSICGPYEFNFGYKLGVRCAVWTLGVGCGVGDNGGNDDDGGIIFPSHPGPIPNVPRDNISRKGIPHSDYTHFICNSPLKGAYVVPKICNSPL